MYPWEPVGAIQSSADDMSIWMRFHLDRGRSLSGKQLVDPTLLADTNKPYIYTPIGKQLRPLYPVELLGWGYGFGWYQGAYAGTSLLYVIGSD
jgi:CubicO group peptidase (beta-lactamase class C family)